MHMTIMKRARSTKRIQAKRILQQRRAHEVIPDYYALHSAPAHHMFGTPDFVDTAGREYRIAFEPTSGPNPPVSRALVDLRATRTDRDSILAMPDATADDLLARYAADNIGVSCVRGRDGTVRLWVRLRRRRTGQVAWPGSGTDLELSFIGSETALPRDVSHDIVQRVRVAHSHHATGTRATGYIDVHDLAPELCDALLARQLQVYASHL